VEYIDRAKEKIWVQTYNSSCSPLELDALLDAYKRGVKVEVIAEKSDDVRAFVNAGIPVSIFEGRYFDIISSVFIVNVDEVPSRLQERSGNIFSIFTIDGELTAICNNPEDGMYINESTLKPNKYVVYFEKLKAESRPYEKKQ
jgi:hypothetical protein